MQKRADDLALRCTSDPRWIRWSIQALWILWLRAKLFQRRRNGIAKEHHPGITYQALKFADSYRHLRTKCFSHSVLKRIDLDASSIFIFVPLPCVYLQQNLNSKLSKHFNTVQKKAKALLDAHSAGGTKLPHAQCLLNFCKACSH